MEAFVIQGGRPLRGRMAVSGSKNAATKMMLASLLTHEQCVLENVPFSLEVAITRELVSRVGTKVSCAPDHVCTLETPEITTSMVPELSRKNRIPILALGPLLHRKGTAEVPLLGGDPIGHRPIDFHISALAKMGVAIERREHSYHAEADEIRGADIELPFPSVGATENIILTAVRAKGRTVISNAAMEPEIMNTIALLRAMGGRIACDASTRSITIEGVSELKGGRMRVIPDRNEIISYASAAIATGGDLFISDVNEEDIAPFLAGIRSMGAGAESGHQGMRFFGTPPYRPLKIETAPHPGFMTDWQQPFCVLLTAADGESIIHETIYEDRLGYMKDLNRMGAEIEISDECIGHAPCRLTGRTFNHSAVIRGPRRLVGTRLQMRDIRAGMAHIVAALAAEGESVITGIEHIDRGYEKIDERLRSLGADIVRKEI